MRIDQIPDPVQRERQLDYNRAIAQKIRNRLQQLENANDKDKRRWIWELLQNAKDTVSDRKVDIEIIATNEYIEFRHNGGYFSPRNITNLIHQISSKEGIEGNIGRFGTGFLTTHTLSRLVDVEGVFFENDNYYNFKLNLNRQSTSEKELVEGIEKSWESFHSEKMEKPEKEIWTIFRYINPNKEVATKTLKDFETFIHYNLAFVQGIGNITINNQLENYKTTFKSTSEPKKINDSLFIFSFLKDNKIINLLFAKNENVNIAIEIKKKDNSFAFKPIAKNIPRIFCAFPLIGTEDFYFPFVVNSSQFIPKTERDRLYLKGETKDAEKNKELLLQAVDLYKKAITFASENNWKDFYVIADTKLPKEDDDFDRNWYQKNIQKNIREFLLTIPIIETEDNKLISIFNSDNEANTYFPYHSNVEIREQIWEFTYDLYPDNIPVKKQIDNWYKIIWNDCYYQTIQVLAETDIQNCENIVKLSEKIEKDIHKTYNWLNEVSLFFGKEKPELFEDYKILPNQYGVFKLKKDLYEDKNISEELKEIYKQLGTDWKEDLLHNTIKIEMSSYRTVYMISEAINTTIRNNELDFSNDTFNDALCKLISYSNENITENHKLIWKFYKLLNKELLPENITVLKNTEKFDWSESLNWIINKLIEDISYEENVTNLKEKLQIETALNWLNDLFLFIQQNEKYKHILDNENLSVLPNQYGIFKLKKDLYEDKNIPEELKEIYKQLGTDWKEDLLHNSIKIEINSYRTVYMISEAINNIVRNNEFDFTDNEFNKTIYNLISFTKEKDFEKHKKIWEFSRTFYYNEIPENLIILKNGNDFDWSESLEWQMNKLVTDISELKYVEILEENLHGITKAIDWLKDLIIFIQENERYKDLLNSDEYPILPNQNGWFYPKAQLFLDDGAIDKELKEALRPINSEWLDELLDINIYLDLPVNRVRSFEDIANEIDLTFRNYPTADREKQQFKEAFEHLYAWFQEQDEDKLKKYFDWTYRNMAMLYLSSVGDVNQRKAVLNIASSGNSDLFSKMANNIKNPDTLEYIAENPKKIEQLIEMEKNGKNSVSKQAVLDEKLKEINKRLDDDKKFSSLDELVNEFIAKDKKIDFMDEPKGESKFVDMQAIKQSNEQARQSIYEYLDNHKDYDTDEWTKVTNTIIKGVKKNGIEIYLVTKGANNGIIYFNDKEKDILKNEKSFSELWVRSNEAVFEINLGKIIEKWNTKLIKANMFDFR